MAEESKTLITGERLLLVLDVLDIWVHESDLSNLRLLPGMDHCPLFSLDKINMVFRTRMIFNNQEHEDYCRKGFREVYEKRLGLTHELLSESEDGIKPAMFDAAVITNAVMQALPREETFVVPFYAFMQIVSDIASGAPLTEADFRE